jgi:hypothetical protein
MTSGAKACAPKNASPPRQPANIFYRPLARRRCGKGASQSQTNQEILNEIRACHAKTVKALNYPG